MQRLQRLDLHRRIIEYLATPRRNESLDIIVDAKGNLIYPTQTETADYFGLDKYTVARVKKRLINYYNEVKKRNEQQISEN